MPISLCSTCGKMISITTGKGANPMATAFPDTFALDYGKCERCGNIHCDSCISASKGKCPNCGSRIYLTNTDKSPRPLDEKDKAMIEKVKAMFADGSFEEIAAEIEPESSKKINWGQLVLATGTILIGILVSSGLLLAGIHYGSRLPNESIGWVIVKAIGLLAMFWVGLYLGGFFNSLVALPVALSIRGPQDKQSRFVNSYRIVKLFCTLGLWMSLPLIYFCYFIWGFDGWRTAYIGIAWVSTFWGGRSMAIRLIESRLE